MDPFERFDFRRRRVNLEAIAAFLVAAIVAFVLTQIAYGRLMFRAGILGTLIVAAVGGLWYHLRRVI